MGDPVILCVVAGLALLALLIVPPIIRAYRKRIELERRYLHPTVPAELLAAFQAEMKGRIGQASRWSRFRFQADAGDRRRVIRKRLAVNKWINARLEFLNGSVISPERFVGSIEWVSENLFPAHVERSPIPSSEWALSFVAQRLDLECLAAVKERDLRLDDGSPLVRMVCGLK